MPGSGGEAVQRCRNPAIFDIQIQDPASRMGLAGRKAGIRSSGMVLAGREAGIQSSGMVLAGRNADIRSSGMVLAGRKGAIRWRELMLVERRCRLFVPKRSWGTRGGRITFVGPLFVKKGLHSQSSGVRTLKPLGGSAAM